MINKRQYIFTLDCKTVKNMSRIYQYFIKLSLIKEVEGQYGREVMFYGGYKSSVWPRPENIYNLALFGLKHRICPE